MRTNASHRLLHSHEQVDFLLTGQGERSIPVNTNNVKGWNIYFPKCGDHPQKRDNSRKSEFHSGQMKDNSLK